MTCTSPIRRITTLALLTLFCNTTLSGCFIKQMREKQEAQIKKQMNASAKIGFTQQWKNYQSQYKQTIVDIELEQAALDGYEQKFTETMKEDPQYNVLIKMRRTSNEKVQRIKGEYPALEEWATATLSAPTMEDTHKMNAKFLDMSQTFSKVRTHYARLRSEYLGLMSRHPTK